MAYDSETVRKMIGPGRGNLPALAQSVGNAEGGSTQAQHEAAIQFWQLALAQTGADALDSTQRAFAEGEVARQQQALQPPAPIGQHRAKVV